MANAIAPWIATTIGSQRLFRKKMFYFLEQVRAVNMHLYFVTELKKRKLLRSFFGARSSSVTKGKKPVKAGFRKHLLEKNEKNAASEHYDVIGYRLLSRTFAFCRQPSISLQPISSKPYYGAHSSLVSYPLNAGKAGDPNHDVTKTRSTNRLP